MSSEHVFAIAGAKGGVGKTTTAINLGAALSERGYSVVVVETDLPMANTVDFLDLDLDPNGDPTLHDVLAGRATVDEAIYAAPGGLDVVPSGVHLEGFAAARIEALPDVVSQLRAAYDVVLLDTGAGLTREVLVPLGLADHVILVSTPRVASVRDVKKTAELAARVGTPVAGVVFTMAGTGTEPPFPEIAGFLGADLLGHVPQDDDVPASQDAGIPVLGHARSGEAAAAYLEVARRLDDRFVSVARTDPTAEEAAGGGSDAPDRAARADGFEFSDPDTSEGSPNPRSAEGADGGSAESDRATDPDTGSGAVAGPSRGEGSRAPGRDSPIGTAVVRDMRCRVRAGVGRATPGTPF